jgi:hypothetical protein
MIIRMAVNCGGALNGHAAAYQLTADADLFRQEHV